jgi:hypothetical protein
VSATSAVQGGADAPDGLDWQAFTATYFPTRRRHDLEALTAYGAYKRSRLLGEQRARNGGSESSALQTWEDEGGPAPTGTA